ncbi:MAG: hypothetical protein HKN13_06025 [Rhodothermales bacterium]|nr:hypothetical protein [Rhodothermales bacterium]
MQPNSTEQRYRRFLLYVAGFVWAGSIVELILAEHTESWQQFVPFVVGAIGLMAVTAVLQKPTGPRVKALRVTSVIAVITSLAGGYWHMAANYELEREVHESASAWTSLYEAFFGASPLLAPGILALAAVLAWASTWQLLPDAEA